MLSGLTAGYLLLFWPGITWVPRLLFGWNAAAPALYLTARSAVGPLILAVLLVAVPYLTASFWAGWQAVAAEPGRSTGGDLILDQVDCPWVWNAVSLPLKDRTASQATVVVLDRLNAAFETGRMTLITGPAGAGKSTLLHLLAGMLRPTGGEIWAGGEPGFPLESAPSRSLAAPGGHSVPTSASFIAAQRAR
jgi:hypothetical protein